MFQTYNYHVQAFYAYMADTAETEGDLGTLWMYDALWFMEN